ncbi:MAG TPA: N-acetylglucosamine-6-phosphate deacetylase [Steroidobacteraceae bacterium]|nr:N-acetylglucosamine-6-phosphate deacetylase [Steroidobacteraceae bacterium]
MSTALLNARILLSDGFRADRAVLIDGERITALVDRSDARVANAQVHDLGGRFLVPGFIDCQVNGGGGVLLNDDPSVAALERMVAAHRGFGTTGLLPTLITTDLEVMRAAIAAVRQAITAGNPGILGIHLEGPLLSPARPGVHDPALFREVDPQLIDLLSSLGVGRTVVTIAPECVPLPAIRELTRRGVILCAGHSGADYATARAAFESGVRGVTHLFNAMSPLQSRDPGMVGAALDDPDCWCGLVVDGHHVHPATLRVAVAAKRRGRMMLVTDAMSCVGTSETSFMLGAERVTCVDGVCKTADGVLAGSALDMANAVRNSVRLLNLPLDEAARMAATYPAEFLGLSAERGRIAEGLRADFVELDEGLRVQQVWEGGRPQL